MQASKTSTLHTDTHFLLLGDIQKAVQILELFTGRKKKQ